MLIRTEITFVEVVHQYPTRDKLHVPLVTPKLPHTTDSTNCVTSYIQGAQHTRCHLKDPLTGWLLLLLVPKRLQTIFGNQTGNRI